jgi:L-aspartate oxidase
LEVATLDALRTRMSADCGVVRDGPGLQRTLDWIEQTGRAAGWPTALVAARLVVAAALARRESRGSHQRSDHPGSGPVARRSRFVRDDGDGLRSLERSMA